MPQRILSTISTTSTPNNNNNNNNNNNDDDNDNKKEIRKGKAQNLIRWFSNRTKDKTSEFPP